MPQSSYLGSPGATPPAMGQFKGPPESPWWRKKRNSNWGKYSIWQVLIDKRTKFIYTHLTCVFAIIITGAKHGIFDISIEPLVVIGTIGVLPNADVNLLQNIGCRASKINGTPSRHSGTYPGIFAAARRQTCGLDGITKTGGFVQFEKGNIVFESLGIVIFVHFHPCQIERLLVRFTDTVEIILTQTDSNLVLTEPKKYQWLWFLFDWCLFSFLLNKSRTKMYYFVPIRQLLL